MSKEWTSGQTCPLNTHTHMHICTYHPIQPFKILRSGQGKFTTTTPYCDHLKGDEVYLRRGLRWKEALIHLQEDGERMRS